MYPERLDLGDLNILASKNAMVKMVINTDEHHVDQLRFVMLALLKRSLAGQKKEILSMPGKLRIC